MTIAKTKKFIALGASILAVTAPPAIAQSGGPVDIGNGVRIDPIIDARVRYETVDQPATDADAITVRLRSGIEIAKSGFSFLAEAEGNLAILEDFNSTTNGNGGIFSVVADPENIELNRLQIKYANKGFGDVILGRQRINIDDQRFVGSVGWRQNEQTFDAIAANVTALKGVTFNASYSNSQRTIFGIEADNRTAFDGDFVFLGAGTKLGPINIKGFSYLLDFDADEGLGPLSNSTQTYGASAAAKFNIGKANLALRARYANQSDYQDNPNDFSADYFDGWASLSYSGFSLIGGYENLGSDNGVGFRTPLATLHKFNGFADVFLGTPGAGLEDKYVKVKYNIPVLGGLNALVAYHNFDSDVGGISYGDEIDAVLSFKVKKANILLKYANYQADGFGVDTERFWIQAAYKF